MNKLLLLLLAAGLVAVACGGAADKENTDVNPFFAEYDTPFQVPPFDKIKPEHYVPAFEKGMADHNAEIDAIVNNTEAPTFDNTVVALDESGELLNRVATVFYGLNSANTSDEIQAINREMSPRLSAHRDGIQLNRELFERVKAVYDGRNDMDLTDEQMYLLERLYKGYVRNGALLDEEQQAKLKMINQQLSKLGVQFSQNLLAETNDFKLVIEDEADLAGLPESVIAGAAEAAAEAGEEGKWVFTTHKPSMLPFLTYSPKRELREKLYMAYTHRGNNENEHDNKDIVAQIMNLRVEKANLLGYETFADYQLETRMAENAGNVYDLLNRLWDAALPVSSQERAEMQAIIDAEGGDFKLASWDWWFYAEKLRKQKYDLDDNELRPYFQLDKVRDGVFWVSNKLYGLTFEPIQDIPRPHPDAQAFEVKDRDGSHLAVLYMDFHPRASKRQGAWCGGYREQYKADGKRINPIVTVVCNFTKPSGDTPALLSLDEVETLFHEFGHALDGMMADATYRTTFISSDFVELPSQIMEHWATHPEVMAHYARHYETGDPMPSELVEKIGNSKFFNQGFATVEYLAASLLDMKYHTLTEQQDLDINRFEKDYLNSIGLIPEIEPRYRTTYFAHIIGWYAAGYYSYIWSGVLDNDAFEAFKENGLFDQETAARFRREVLAKNGTKDYMDMYKAFRGREPKIEPLLKNRGLM